MENKLTDKNNELAELERMTREVVSFSEIQREFYRCTKELGAHDPCLQEFVNNYKKLRLGY